MTISRFVVAVALAAAALNPAAASEAQTTTTEQATTGRQPVMVTYPQGQSINQMPILNRPDRPGHPVGNTLRSINRGGLPLPFSPFRRW